MSKICAKCNFNNSDEAEYCQNCGEKILDKISDFFPNKKCSNCGMELSSDSEFCSNCGTHVNSESRYNQVERLSTVIHNHNEGFNKKLFLVFGVIILIVSIVAMLAFRDMGLFVLIIPIVLLGGLGLVYLKEKIRNKVFYGVNSTINKRINKKKE